MQYRYNLPKLATNFQALPTQQHFASQLYGKILIFCVLHSQIFVLVHRKKDIFTMWPADRYLRYNTTPQWFQVGHPYLDDVMAYTDGYDLNKYSFILSVSGIR
jgi:hypothetical protein